MNVTAAQQIDLMAKASSDRISHAGEPDSATTKLHAPAGKAPEVTKGTAMKKRETDASPDMPTEVSFDSGLSTCPGVGGTWPAQRPSDNVRELWVYQSR
jgi:hypothetical protein